MNNLPVKTFNYGQTEYFLCTKVHRVLFHSGFFIRTPYIVETNKNEILGKILNKFYKKLPKRFISLETREIKDKKGNHVFDIKGYKLSQALLSYVIQNKEKIYNSFTVVKNIFKESYIIEDYKTQFEFRNKFFIKNGIYDIEVHKGNEKTKILKIRVESEKHKRNIFRISNTECSVKSNSKINNDRRLLNISKIEKKHYYEEFVKELSKFFQGVNCENSDDWDSYLKTEVNKLLTTTYNKSLDDLQTLTDKQRERYENY